MTIKKNKNTGAIILAAGLSQRMKTPKPFLLFNKSQTFIEKIISNYQLFGCKKIVVVTNKELVNKFINYSNVKYVINDKLEYERFYSIKLGLQNIGKCDFCFVQNVDNPFIDKDILTYIFSENLHDACIVPCFNNKGGHPILLPKKITDKIKNIKQNNVNFKNILKKFKNYNLGIPKSEILININSPKEYNFYFKN
ncbi:MAG: hypothetical protein COS14_14355 [Bacteroidetes bacterium CG02_land_8_20_14_3_00_31_25]|nr:NTP transferase domain-containing protein [Bacteroidota bacterium]PIV57528.1 MAG: hypothetical protein COS14_14355 [Bacteroidetes bacterium CG02_land_8_20_14_3_00_31_25]PIX36519.1 MAG: hypothetical protein COZ59_00655 [Bacteroidetes bacterium CG_4_8_14_3_um_filter_31_14]